MTCRGISFERVHQFTATWEGGLSEHPNDPGGITHYGVSLRWLQELGIDLNGDGIVDAEDIRACSLSQAALLMRQRFWEPLGCARLPAPLAAVLYDTAVNCGSGRAVRLLQQSCNMVGDAHLDDCEALREDGICGPRTQAMARALAGSGLAYYTARHCVRNRQAWYRTIVRSNPSLQVFLRGWNNRCAALLDFLAEMERED